MKTEHDLLVLPYRTTGGYSAALDFAACTAIPILAYDTPQLREQSDMFGADVTFVSPSELTRGIRSVLTRIEGTRRNQSRIVALHLQETKPEISQFAEFLTNRSRKRSDRTFGNGPRKALNAIDPQSCRRDCRVRSRCRSWQSQSNHISRVLDEHWNPPMTTHEAICRLPKP